MTQVVARDGSGTLKTPSRTAVIGSTGNTVIFTYNAAAGGIVNGEIDIVPPPDWSKTSTNPTDPGYVTASAGNVQAGITTGGTISG